MKAAGRARRDLLLARLLLAVILLAAPASLAMMLFWQEPYPSVAMPGFGSSWEKTGELEWLELRIVAVTERGERLELTPDDLLPGVRVARPTVLLSAFVRGLDAEGGPLEPPRRVPLVERVLVGIPAGLTAAGTTRAYDPRTITWMQARMAELFPEERVAEIRFRVEDRRMHPGRPDAVEAEAVQVVTVRLSDP